VTSGDLQPGMIAEVSLRLLYLIFSLLLSRPTLLGHASSAKDIELLVLRHQSWWNITTRLPAALRKATQWQLQAHKADLAQI
jgi:hypothetical protein